MKIIYKETEMDKISHELLNEIYPMDSLQKFYWLGMAETLNALNKIAEKYDKPITPDEFKYLISNYVNSHEMIKEFYNRLQK